MAYFEAPMPFQAGGDNSVSYYPATYPVTDPSVVVERDGVAVEPGAALTADAENERYTQQLTGATECAEGEYRFEFKDGDVTLDVFYVYCVELANVSMFVTPTEAKALGYEVDAPSLAKASARVKGYTKQDITYGASTKALRFPFLLPQRPVIAVTSVLDEDGVALTTDDYTLEGQKLVVSDAYKGAKLTVAWTHGFTCPLPDDLVEVVCSIAARIYSMPDGLRDGAQVENASGLSVTWGVDAYRGTTNLLDEEKKRLRGIFPRVPSVAVTM
jgi:hypothetical protein